VVAWGSNFVGEGAPPAGLSNVTAIAAGDYFNMALKCDGTVVTWGAGPGVPADLSDVVEIAAGRIAAALKADGSALAWSAQLSTIPTTDVLSIAGAGFYVMGLSTVPAPPSLSLSVAGSNRVDLSCSDASPGV